MTPSKARCQVSLPDLDPSIALAQAACQDLEREFIAHRPALDQLIEHGKKERARFTEALRRHFAKLLKSNMPDFRRPDAPVRSDLRVP